MAVIKRIKACITEENFKTLYYTLFESHLLYGISAWGGICHTRLENVFRLQKKCIRIFFGHLDGDLDKYMDKFYTCSRTRPYENQVLTSEFYMKELTKPIFNEKMILTIYNLYHYTSLCELAKILKYECPKPLLDSYNLSQRNNRNLIFLPSHKNYQFNYKSSALWDQLLKSLKIPSVYEMDINVFKFTLKIIY